MNKRILALLLALLLPLCPVLAETAPSDEVELEQAPAITPLPMDFSGGHVASEANYSVLEDGSAVYQDDSLLVEVHKEIVDGDAFVVAHVRIADPSQLRAAVAGKNRDNKVTVMAKKANAVLAIGGTCYNDRKIGYIVRMGEVIRAAQVSKSLDVLVIDVNGDFHIVPAEKMEEVRAEQDKKVQGKRNNYDAAGELLEALIGVPAMHVFNFGPALVVDGELVQIPEKYSDIGNIKGREPRCAIGQIGTLEYLVVIVDGRRASDPSEGCTVEKVARYMWEAGCVQAYNLDGGNTAEMVFHGEIYNNKTTGGERSQSDTIYFATAIDFGLD